MKLYKIKVLHGAPKDSHTSIEEYILAEDDLQVFEYLRDGYREYLWSESDFEEGEFETYEELKQNILENRGDLESEEGWEDAYYGITKYGWEEVGEISKEEIDTLRRLKILK